MNRNIKPIAIFVYPVIVALMTASVLWAQAEQQSEELHFAFLRPVCEGSLSTDAWKSVDQSQAHELAGVASDIAGRVAGWNEAEFQAINDAFDFRFGAMRSGRIDGNSPVVRATDPHTDLMNLVRRMRLPDPTLPVDPISIPNLDSEQFLAFSQLIVLETLRAGAEGDFDKASQTLAGGFGLSRWWQLATETGTLMRAVILENKLTRGFVDLQGLGAPVMTEVMGRLAQTPVPIKAIEDWLWRETCDLLPLLEDKRRRPGRWNSDLVVSLKSLEMSPAIISHAIETTDSELVGRTLQDRIAKRLIRLELSQPLRYEFGGLSKDYQPPRDRQIEARSRRFAATFDQLVDKVFVDAISLIRDLTSRTERELAGLRCMELIRLDSQTHQRWTEEIGDDLRRQLLPDPATGSPFEIMTSALAPGIPNYRLIIPGQEPGESPRHIAYTAHEKFPK